MCAEGSRGQKKLLKKILSIWLKASYPRVPSKSDIWMETRLKNNWKLKPRQLAIQCANHLKIPKEMIPYLIKLAQRVKQRLRMRERRHPVPIERESSSANSFPWDLKDSKTIDGTV